MEEGDDGEKGFPPLATVHHLEVALRVDPRVEHINGAVELRVAREDGSSGEASLHADPISLSIQSLKVAGEGAAFTHSGIREDRGKRTGGSKPKEAATAARGAILDDIGKKEFGELRFSLHEGVNTVTVTFTARPVRAGAAAVDGEFFNVIPRFPGFLSCWMPCNAETRGRSTYDVTIATPTWCQAVCSGSLWGSYMDEENGVRTFRYNIDVPSPAEQVVIAVGNFEWQVDESRPEVMHYVPPGCQASIGLAKECVNVPVALFTEIAHMSADAFLQSNYAQVFLPMETGYGVCYSGKNVVMLGCEWLASQKHLEASLELRLLCSRLLAKQVFGVALMPQTPGDFWALEGMARLLEHKFTQRLAGLNEATYRRTVEAAAVKSADDGALPPLGERLSGGVPPRGMWRCTWDGGSPEQDELMCWKAGLVALMLERRVGEDGALRVLKRLARGSSRLRSGGKKGDHHHHARSCVISSNHVLEHMRKAGGLEQGDLRTFAERCIYGSGAPTFHVGTCYQKRGNMLEFAIKEDGPPCALKSASMAAHAAKAHAWGASITVRVHEQDGWQDHKVPLGTQAFNFAELTLRTRSTNKRKDRRKGGGGGSKDTGQGQQSSQQGASQQQDVSQQQQQQKAESPVQWITVDPEREWLIYVDICQSEQAYMNMLEKDRDVGRQVEAIEELAERAAQGSLASVDALVRAMKREETFCRVRAAAAAALGRSSGEGTQWKGMSELLNYFRSRRVDPGSGAILPPRLDNLKEHIVDTGILEGLASARDSSGCSPQDAVEVILESLEESSPVEASSVDESQSTAHLLSLCSLLRPGTSETLEHLINCLKRHLKRERLLPSLASCVGCAAVNALGSLVASCQAEGGAPVTALHSAIKECLPWASAPLRRACYGAMFRGITGADSSFSEGFAQVVKSHIAKEKSPLVRATSLWDAATITAASLVHTSDERNVKVPKFVSRQACSPSLSPLERFAACGIVHAFAKHSFPCPLAPWGTSIRNDLVTMQERAQPHKAKLTVRKRSTVPFKQDHAAPSPQHHPIQQKNHAPAANQVGMKGDASVDVKLGAQKAQKAGDEPKENHQQAQGRRQQPFEPPSRDTPGMTELLSIVPPGIDLRYDQSAAVGIHRLYEQGQLEELLYKTFEVALQGVEVGSSRWEHFKNSKKEWKAIVMETLGTSPNLLRRDAYDIAKHLKREINAAGHSYFSEKERAPQRATEKPEGHPAEDVANKAGNQLHEAETNLAPTTEHEPGDHAPKVARGEQGASAGPSKPLKVTIRTKPSGQSQSVASSGPAKEEANRGGGEGEATDKEQRENSCVGNEQQQHAMDSRQGALEGGQPRGSPSPAKVPKVILKRKRGE